MDTSTLIAQLAQRSEPVRLLPAPWRRAWLWLAIAAPYVALVVLVGPIPHDVLPMMRDGRFLLEQAATLATAMTAAVVAFASVIPGYNRRILLLPLVPLCFWLASLGEGCLQDWLVLGEKGVTVKIDWMCLSSAAWIGIVPAIAMAVMLRRGAPLFPRASIALGGLAVAALANFGLRLYHLGDVSIMVLVWHFGSVVVLSALAASVGRYLLAWRHLRTSTPTA